MHFADRSKHIFYDRLPTCRPLLLALLLICLSGCAPSGGVLGGGSWQSGGLTHQHIRVLAVDTNNVQNVYAGDEQGSVFASSDAGQHWVQHSTGLVLPNTIHALSFDATGKKLYVASNAGIFMSIDAAKHWSSVGNRGRGLPADSYTALAFDLHTPHTIYAGSAHHNVFVSADDGHTWRPILQGLPVDASINNLTFDSDNHQLW